VCVCVCAERERTRVTVREYEQNVWDREGGRENEGEGVCDRERE